MAVLFLKKIPLHVQSGKESIALYLCSQATIFGIDTCLRMSVNIVYTSVNMLLYAVHAFIYILKVMIRMYLVDLFETH